MLHFCRIGYPGGDRTERCQSDSFVILSRHPFHCLHLASSKELKIYRNGNSAKLFSRAGNGKYFEELFSHIFNEIVVSAFCVGPAGCQAARLPAWWRHVQGTKAIENKKTEN